MINLEKKIAVKTLNILKKQTLNKLSLDDVLKKNINSKIKNKIKSKIDLLNNISRYIDNLLIDQMKSIEKSSNKDMLFEVLMARFDLLQKYRLSFISIYEGLKKSPQKFIKLLPSFLESMIISAELATFNVNGFKGTIRLKGLIIVYFATFFVWLEDNTASLEKTMMALDKNLNQAEKFGKLLS